MKKLFTVVVLLLTNFIFAQEETQEKLKNFTFSGSVDTYYRANLTAPNDENQIAPSTSFADKSGFSLGMANIISKYEKGKVGAVADLAFGPRAIQASFIDSTFVNQLYVYYNISETVKLTAGKFNTYLGYELISPVGNFNYSTSYLFTNGPFNHTGLKADFSLSEKTNLLIGVFNQTDVNLYNPNGSYALGGQLNYDKHFFNVLYDKAGLGLEMDYTGGFNPTELFFIGVNGAYADNEGEGFYGGALYPQYTLNDNFTLGLRGEYFARHSDLTEDDPNVIAITLTGSYTVEDLTIKPEFRLDNGSEEIFIKTNLEPTKTLGSFLIAAIYKF
ncbi:conserved exported hypothetical protein [Flavobacterium sp. 9AF]|uniref:outer membrane beta-barrel protein n=1 Tax=Flavobacterium sp. 9AF TaxID=2653142 RepID=UPI0012F0363F|nr:outer membrane beta-barrel protein [Flavobacterium sp. 9AF]VXC35277.1 conserved exported hypothetical protein [Flavobacterium sp. 9AF]